VDVRSIGTCGPQRCGKTTGLEITMNLGWYFWPRRFNVKTCSRSGSDDYTVVDAGIRGLRYHQGMLRDAARTLSGRHGGMSRKRGHDIAIFMAAAHRITPLRMKVEPQDPSGIFFVGLDFQHMTLIDVSFRKMFNFFIWKSKTGDKAEMTAFRDSTNDNPHALACLVDITNRRDGGDHGAKGEGVWVSRGGDCGHLNLRPWYDRVEKPKWEYTEGIEATKEYQQNPINYARRLVDDWEVPGQNPGYKSAELHLVIDEMEPQPPHGLYVDIAKLYKGLIQRMERKGLLDAVLEGRLVFDRWLEERCNMDVDANPTFAEIAKDYRSFCAEMEVEALDNARLSRIFRTAGISSYKGTDNVTFLKGISLK
jgi:hypothetical protein